MKWKTVLTICLSAFLFSLNIFAGVKVTNLELKLREENGTIVASFSGNSTELPELKVNQNVIEMEFNKSEAFHLINKKINGALLTAYNLNNKAVVKAVLPYKVTPEAVQVNYLNNKIEITFPRNRINATSQITHVVNEKISSPVESLASVGQTEEKVDKKELDEKFLNKLIEEERNEKKQKVDKLDLVQSDHVSTKLSSQVKTEKLTENAPSNEFSFASYAVKFFVFLLLVLALFYGVVQLMKKGLLSKGKLSFLNDSKLIEVLNTSYVAPKKSLMLVKVHKQIFLISNTDSGLNFMTEISDTAGLIKETEKIISGDNFDEKIEMLSHQEDLNVKLKENIQVSTPELNHVASLKNDVVKFSDELKRKAKKLKPIENRVN